MLQPVSRGLFITFEGGEGTGKSTQIRLAGEFLRTRGFDVVVTREPGGSEGAERVRDLLVNGPADRWSPLSEALLLNAARHDHLEKHIRPALDRGAHVLCDRFADSTRAYQGAAGGVDAEILSVLERMVVGETRPALTLILDAPAELGLRRAASRAGGEARFESKGLPFHERLRAGYRALAAAEPERCVLIDATLPLEDVSNAVQHVLAARLGAPT